MNEQKTASRPEESKSANTSRPHPGQQIEISLTPSEGWHCSHLYYEFDRSLLSQIDGSEQLRGCKEVDEVLCPDRIGAPKRLQTSIVSGHKADFGLMIMDPNPLVVDSVHQKLMATKLGPAITPTYSFVSVSEVSEYVPTVEQYAENLVTKEGLEKDSTPFKKKVEAYEKRLPIMNHQRLTPDFPDWPATCFYPMNKKRKVGENWFTLSLDQRRELMAEHAISGMKFMGKVSQLITVGLGFDDWEWGVTLWAKNPEFLKDIVYKMRFDEASARYAEFGAFYASYVCSPKEMLRHCQIYR